jgi:hypothetical protein
MSETVALPVQAEHSRLQELRRMSRLDAAVVCLHLVRIRGRNEE